MKYFKTVYSESLFKFPMNDSSIFEITSEDDSGEFYRYGSLTWNIDHFIRMLTSQVPKAVNLLFIPEEFWIYEKDAYDMDLCFWVGLQKIRNEFVTVNYAKAISNVLGIHIESCIQSPSLSQRANVLDLVRIIFGLEIAINTISYNEVKYPMYNVLRYLDSIHTRHELISRIIGRKDQLDLLVKNCPELRKEVFSETEIKLSSLRERMLQHDG